MRVVVFPNSCQLNYAQRVLIVPMCVRCLDPHITFRGGGDHSSLPTSPLVPGPSTQVAREASSRVLGLRPFDVQLLGGILLHKGEIAEMRTGEGKTLVAVLPAYLNALAGGIRGLYMPEEEMYGEAGILGVKIMADAMKLCMVCDIQSPESPPRPPPHHCRQGCARSDGE